MLPRRVYSPKTCQRYREVTHPDVNFLVQHSTGLHVEQLRRAIRHGAMLACNVLMSAHSEFLLTCSSNACCLVVTSIRALPSAMPGHNPLHSGAKIHQHGRPIVGDHDVPGLSTTCSTTYAGLMSL